MRAPCWRVLTFVAISCIAACTSDPTTLPMAVSPENSQATLAACPAAPHCVSSEEIDASHQVAPLLVSGDAQAAWTGLLGHLRTMPRVQIVELRANYVHATATSVVLRFVDDVEFLLRIERGEIEVRSASRVGYYDFNVNRARVETVREALRGKGLLK